MSRITTYDSQGNDITCMKEFDALQYPCDECNIKDCEEREYCDNSKGKTRAIRRYWVDYYGKMFCEWDEYEYKNHNSNKPTYKKAWKFYCPICGCGGIYATQQEAKKHKILHNGIGCKFRKVSYGDEVMTCFEKGVEVIKIGTENFKVPYFKSYEIDPF